MLTHDFTLATFSDSGAHAAQEMGSSLQTHFIHYWVNRRGAFTLEQAIRKMTSFPAQRLGLPDRGLLRDGFKADVVVFEPRTVKAPATRTEPKQFPVGIDHVLVNGVVVVEGGRHTGARPGRVLRRGPGGVA